MIPALLSMLLLVEEPAAATQKAEPENKAEEKICRIDKRDTGSRVRKKLCLTQTEWDQRAQGRDAADLKGMGAR